MGEGYIPHPIQKWLDIFRENVDELWVQGDKKNKELHVETTVLVILLTLQKKISIKKRPVSLKKSFRPQWCHDIMGFLSRMPEKTWENLGLQITANRIYTFICTSKICTWSRAYSFRNTWHCPGSSKRLLLVSSEWPRLTKVIDPLLSPSPHIPCFSSCLFCGRAFFRCFFSAAWNLVYFECFFTCVFLPKGFNWL